MQHGKQAAFTQPTPGTPASTFCCYKPRGQRAAACVHGPIQLPVESVLSHAPVLSTRAVLHSAHYKPLSGLVRSAYEAGFQQARNPTGCRNQACQAA